MSNSGVIVGSKRDQYPGFADATKCQHPSLPVSHSCFTMFNTLNNGQYVSQWSISFTLVNISNIPSLQMPPMPSSKLACLTLMFHNVQHLEQWSTCFTMVNILHSGQLIIIFNIPGLMPPNAIIQACLSRTHFSQCPTSLTMVNIFHSGQYFQYLQYSGMADATVQACLSHTHLNRDNAHT